MPSAILLERVIIISGCLIIFIIYFILSFLIQLPASSLIHTLNTVAYQLYKALNIRKFLILEWANLCSENRFLEHSEVIYFSTAIAMDCYASLFEVGTSVHLVVPRDRDAEVISLSYFDDYD